MVSLSSCSKQNILNYFLNLEESETIINLSLEVEILYVLGLCIRHNDRPTNDPATSWLLTAVYKYHVS